MDSNLAMWSLIVGTVLPPLIAIIQQPGWKTWVRTVVAVIIAIIAGFGTVYFLGGINTEDWITSTLIVLVASIATYKGMWAPAGIAPTIETATAIKGSSSAP